MVCDTRTIGVLLAGGQSARMGGGDKCLRVLHGRPMLEYVIDSTFPQVLALALNANGDPRRFDGYGMPVIADSIEGFAGPLAGILAGMEWTRHNAPGCPWIATYPIDAPFLPADLQERLRAALEAEGADMACARSGGRDHPVIGLWPVALAADLRRAMEQDGIRKVDEWTARYKVARAEFADTPFDPFFNVNSPEDFASAERRFA